MLALHYRLPITTETLPYQSSAGAAMGYGKISVDGDVRLPARVVYDLIAELHDVDNSRRNAFVAQIHSYIRHGLQLSNRPGKGRETMFCAADFWVLSIAIELAQTGLTPSRIFLLLKNSHQVIKRDVYRLSDAWLRQQAGDPAFFKLPSVVWVVKLEALQHFARPNRPYVGPENDTIISTDLKSIFEEEISLNILEWRTLHLNATKMISFYLLHIRSKAYMSEAEIRQFSEALRVKS